MDDSTCKLHFIQQKSFKMSGPGSSVGRGAIQSIDEIELNEIWGLFWTIVVVVFFYYSN